MSCNVRSQVESCDVRSQVAMYACGPTLAVTCDVRAWGAFKRLAKCNCNFTHFVTKEGTNFISNLIDDFSEESLRCIMFLCVKNW